MLILADDLTGAADAGAAFASNGLRTVVVLDDGNQTLDLVEAEVVSVDVASRAMAVEDAAAATISALRRFQDVDARSTIAESGRGDLFVKIDSTLRGHIAATVAAVMATLESGPRRVVVCPAFPALGRTVVDHRVHVDGSPLFRGDLREMLGELSARADVIIADARTDDDLAALVRSIDDDVLWVGSAGLARHVARRHVAARRAHDATAPYAPVAVRPRCDVVTVVAGSQHERTAEQLAQLDAGTRVVRPDPRAPALGQLRAAIANSDGLVLTGGQTARAVLDLLGVRQIRLGGDVELGVPWGLAEREGRPLAVVTKAGGFGTTGSLRRAVAFLTQP